MAVEVQLLTIFQKTSNFKVCRECSAINWYGNEKCVKEECCSTSFDEDEIRVINNVGKEYSFWKEEGYSEDDSDEVYYEV